MCASCEIRQPRQRRQRRRLTLSLSARLSLGIPQPNEELRPAGLKNSLRQTCIRPGSCCRLPTARSAFPSGTAAAASACSGTKTGFFKNSCSVSPMPEAAALRDSVKLEYWTGESAWQGRWEAVNARAEKVDDALLWSLPPKQLGHGTQKVRWIFLRTTAARRQSHCGVHPVTMGDDQHPHRVRRAIMATVRRSTSTTA